MSKTPVQKSIAEIEAMRDEFNPMCDEFTLLDKAVEALTANLEYERGEFKNAYNQGHFDGNDGCEMDFNDYYTKTYEHERKD